MSYGLMPSQMEEWKRKNKIRYFVEDRLLEARDIFLYLKSVFEMMIDLTHRSIRIINNNRRLALQFVIVAILFALTFI